MTLAELCRAAELLPPGSALTIPREALLQLLAARGAAVESGNGKLASAEPKPAPAPDRLLDAEEAAALLGMAPRWLYRHADSLPFTRRLGRKALRFSEQGLHRWVERRR